MIINSQTSVDMIFIRNFIYSKKNNSYGADYWIWISVVLKKLLAIVDALNIIKDNTERTKQKCSHYSKVLVDFAFTRNQ